MRAIEKVGWSALCVVFAAAGFAACSASGSPRQGAGGAGGSGGDGGSGGLGVGGQENLCGTCLGSQYTSCDGNGVMSTQDCPASCTPGKGCTACSPSGTICVGNDVHDCSGDGMAGGVKSKCDAAKGEVCSNGACVNGCQLAMDEPSNVGCEFFAVDLDLSDGVSDPAAGPWGVVLANAGEAPADVVIEQNDAPYGKPVSTSSVHKVTIAPGSLDEFTMPVRIVDCAAKPGDFASPGTCLSSNAFRITSTVPIVVYQFNNLAHGYSTDASLLLPTTSVGTKYRVTGWPVAHSFPSPGAFVQRSYVTIVGTKPGTNVTIKPSWRLKGNGPVAPTAAGALLKMQIGPFDVLNLESDDATLMECFAMMTPPYCADLTGTAVDADQPIAVWSGTEESGVGIPEGGPMPPDPSSMGCCNQHLEEQLFPVESFGKKFLVTRSPIRSDSNFTDWVEPDVLRFVGAAATATVTTNLPKPYDSFTLKPGEVKDAWTQGDFVATSTEPIVIAQLLVGGDYAEPEPKGDPSFTIFPAIEQARTEYVFLSPSGWKENWVVIGAVQGTDVQIDGAKPTNCILNPAGMIDGKAYESRRCPLAAGAHKLSGAGPFQIMAYGYADADAYAFAGGADIKKIYVPPPLY
jgi:IgGFc binding protein